MSSGDECLLEVEGVKKKAAVNRKSPSFSEPEKSMLLELVSSKRNILECKQSDPSTIITKQGAWADIEVAFNSASGVTKRSSVQLKRAWENLKSRAKNEKAKAVRSAKKTGGGRPENVLSKQSELVCSIIPTQMNSLQNEFDSDGIGIAGDEQIRQPETSSTTASSRKTSTSSGSSANTTDKKIRSVDKRSFVIQMEEEEHVLNMQILKRKLEYEELKINKVKREMELSEMESHQKLKLLELQISSCSPAQQFANNEIGLLEVYQ